MQTRNHFALAKYLIKAVGLPKLDRCRKAFILGNISPDINIFTHIRGHNMKSFSSIAARKLCRLSKKTKPDWLYAYHIGVITHYLADCFTYPHNEKCNVNFSQHVAYEKCLRSQFKAFFEKAAEEMQLGPVKKIRKEDIFRFFNETHSQYMKKRLSISDDCQYIIYTSECMLKQIAA